MKTGAFFLVFIMFLVACSSSKKTTATKKAPTTKVTRTDIFRGGTSFENAIIIKVETEAAGVQEEYKWLSQNYPGYATLRKSQTSNANRHYDVIKIRTRNGDEKNIYFDISSFFGKR